MSRFCYATTLIVDSLLSINLLKNTSCGSQCVSPRGVIMVMLSEKKPHIAPIKLQDFIEFKICFHKLAQYFSPLFSIILSFSNVWIYSVVGVYPRSNKDICSVFFKLPWRKAWIYSPQSTNTWHCFHEGEREKKRLILQDTKSIWTHRIAIRMPDIWTPDVHHWLILKDFTLKIFIHLQEEAEGCEGDLLAAALSLSPSLSFIIFEILPLYIFAINFRAQQLWSADHIPNFCNPFMSQIHVKVLCETLKYFCIFTQQTATNAAQKITINNNN